MCANGNPEEGIALANLFLDKGLITYLQGQKMAREDSQASASKMITKAPLAVIVNRGTAGAAEIAAAALLDSKRADVVGERTYGDAAVRKPVPMDDGSAVILSVAKYYSPSGKAIQDTAVTPNVLKPMPTRRRSTISTTTVFRIRRNVPAKTDPMMKRAIITIEKPSN